MAQTQTRTRQQTRQQPPAQQPPQQAPQNGQLQTIEQPRLPYPPPGVLRHYGFDGAQWRTFVEAVWPGAKTVEGVLMALDYCKARRLDPFKRPVHIVPIYDKSKRREVESVWPGINEVRTTASRTGLLAGWDPTKFGPSKKFGWTDGEGEDRAPIQRELEHPEWAQVTVYRLDATGTPRAYPGPVIRWREYYATAGFNTIAPNAMWRRKTWFMLEKCAQAAALRAAFPEELGNDYTAEEMAGQIIDHVPTPGEAPTRPRRDDFMVPEHQSTLPPAETVDQGGGQTIEHDEGKEQGPRQDAQDSAAAEGKQPGKPAAARPDPDWQRRWGALKVRAAGDLLAGGGHPMKQLANDAIELIKVASKLDLGQPVLTTPAMLQLKKDAPDDFERVRTARRDRFALLEDDERGG